MLKEFRDFAMRGNVMDLAIAVIIGGAFGKIIASLVGDILMPLIGLLLGGLTFSELSATVNGVDIPYGVSGVAPSLASARPRVRGGHGRLGRFDAGCAASAASRSAFTCDS